MNAKILLAGEYTDKVIVKSNFINGDNCTIDDGVIFSHAEGKDSSISSNYSHVDGVSSSIGTNSERGHIIGNNSDITDSANSIIIGQYSKITKSPNSIVLGNASIEPPINGVENNIIIGSNTKVTSGSNNIIIGAHSSTTDVSPSRENCIYLYTPNGMDDIYINDNKLSELTNTFGMRDVYTTLQDNNGISFVTSKDASVEYTTVSAVSSKAPVFDLHESRKVLVKDYSDSELANSDSPLYSASIGYVDRKFDGIGVNGVSLSLTDVTSSADYFIVSFDKTAGSGIYATVNASIVDNNSSEYHYNFGFELHYVNDSVGISSDTYILNTNNINLFKNTLSVVYTTDYDNKINVYIRVNPSVKNISLNITVKHTEQSNAIFKKLEKLTNAISGTQVGLSFTNKSILQSSGNTFEVDFTSSTRVKAKTVSLSNSIIDSYKNDVVTCGLLKEVRSNVVNITDVQTITGNKTFSGECYVKNVDIKNNLNTTKSVNCSSLNKYLTSLGLNSNSTYVTIGTEQTITGKKTFTEDVTFTKSIFGGNGTTNGLNILNTSTKYGLCLVGGNKVGNGARLILDPGSSGGSWSIRAGSGGQESSKSLLGTINNLTWGGDRVLTEIEDLNPILSKIKEIEKTIGLINKTLEDNVGNFTSSQPNNPQPSPVDKLEQIYDNTYVYICDRTINYYTPTKTVNIGQECTLLGLATCEEWCSSLIKCGSNVFLQSKAYDIVTKKSTISPTTLTLSCQGTYDWYAAAAAVLCYEKNINVEQHFINRNGATGDRTNTKSIVINKDAVLVLLCGSGNLSSTYIAINGQRIITTDGISNAHRVMQVEKNTTVELHCEGSYAWWAFAHIFVLTPS